MTGQYIDDEEKLMLLIENQKEGHIFFESDSDSEDDYEDEKANHIQDIVKRRTSKLERWKSRLLNTMIILGVTLLICLSMEISGELSNIKNLLFEYDLIDDFEIEIDDNFDFSEWIPSNIREENWIDDVESVKLFPVGVEDGHDQVVLGATCVEEDPNMDTDNQTKEGLQGEELLSPNNEDAQNLQSKGNNTNDEEAIEQDQNTEEEVLSDYNELPKRSYTELFDNPDIIEPNVEYKDRTEYPGIDFE